MTFKYCVPKLAICLAVVALVACKKDEAPVQTVDWYKEHSAERAQVIADCNNNPGEKVATPNCINAKQADNQTVLEKRGGYRSRAPMDFKDK